MLNANNENINIPASRCKHEQAREYQRLSNHLHPVHSNLLEGLGDSSNTSPDTHILPLFFTPNKPIRFSILPLLLLLQQMQYTN
jgi:hypothetical protein